MLVRVGLNAVGEARWEGRCSSSAAREAAAPASVLRSSAPTPPSSRVMVANLALELAPIRVNLLLPGSSTAPVRNAARRPARRAPRLASRDALPIGRADGAPRSACTSRPTPRSPARPTLTKVPEEECAGRRPMPCACHPEGAGLTRFWSAKDSRDVRYPVSGWRRPGVRFEFRGNPIPAQQLIASFRQHCSGPEGAACRRSPQVDAGRESLLALSLVKPLRRSPRATRACSWERFRVPQNSRLMQQN